MMKIILYLHAGAEMYGADKILLELVTGLDKSKFHPIVVLPNDGILKDKLIENGIETYVVHYPILRRKYFILKVILNYGLSYFGKSNDIVKLLKYIKIDIIYANYTTVLERITVNK